MNLNLQKAVSEFSEKFERFNKASTDGKNIIQSEQSAETRLETLMAEKDFAFKKKWFQLTENIVFRVKP